MDRPFTVEHHGRNVHVVRLKTSGAPKEWEWRCLLRGDAHHDNPHADHDIERDLLDQCVANGWGWLDIGDLFCAMGGTGDSRAVKGHTVRPECDKANYCQALAEYNGSFYEPYIDNCITIGHGNHETSVLKHKEVDLLDLMQGWILAKRGRTFQPGGYTGMVSFQISNPQGPSSSFTLAYDHGRGGGAFMSFGTLDIRRWASYVDADVYVSGHIHRMWQHDLVRARLSTSAGAYKIVQSPQHHVCVPTTKDEWGTGEGGFGVEKLRDPRPRGAWWMKVRLRPADCRHYILPDLYFERARRYG